ncbi:MAG: hypothetical protein JRH04_12545 [Deltaproteobacteria bacterium]|nr:hypothetical protein [Deltaproteobacteria bacterium]
MYFITLFHVDSLPFQNYICLMPETSLNIKGILGKDGLLAQSLPSFEFRSSQLQMALLLEEALQKKIPAIVEAGTGTGKTFGSLLF